MARMPMKWLKSTALKKLLYRSLSDTVHPFTLDISRIPSKLGYQNSYYRSFCLVTAGIDSSLNWRLVNIQKNIVVIILSWLLHLRFLQVMRQKKFLHSDFKEENLELTELMAFSSMATPTGECFSICIESPRWCILNYFLIKQFFKILVRWRLYHNLISTNRNESIDQLADVSRSLLALVHRSNYCLRLWRSRLIRSTNHGNT